MAREGAADTVVRRRRQWGLALIAGGDWLALHLATQLVLLVTSALHVGLVLKHTVVHRHSHLRRML